MNKTNKMATVTQSDRQDVQGRSKEMSAGQSSKKTNIHIYIYCHPQKDFFVLSELFSVARHAGRSKPGSKPVQLYVRLSFRPVGHQVDYVG